MEPTGGWFDEIMGWALGDDDDDGRQRRDLSGHPPPPKPHKKSKRTPGTPPRYLNDQDLNSFMQAAEDRAAMPTQLISDFFDKLVRWHPVRCQRIARDIRWLRRKAAKNGLDPDKVIRHL